MDRIKTMMGEYWVDENNNKWTVGKFSEAEAIFLSQTLGDCYNCTDCVDCYNCQYCTDCCNCNYCHNCHDCRNCYNCRSCSYCRICRSCMDCRSCHGCDDCTDCYNCHNCHNCHNCQDWQENPERILSPKIGSRNSHTMIYFNRKGKTYVRCGCFSSTLDEFKNRVKEVYSKENDHYKEYMNFISNVENYINA